MNSEVAVHEYTNLWNNYTQKNKFWTLDKR